MHARLPIAAALAALLLSSAAPPPHPIAPPAPRDSTSPVRCQQIVGEPGMPRVRHPIRIAPRPMMHVMAPPPSEMLRSQNKIVPISRIAAPGYAFHERNRERYEGKEVAAIQSVADAPVSTFSVDVDTGSYANVRRFLKDGQRPPADAVRTEELINYFRYDYPRPADRTRPFSVTTSVARTPWNAQSRLLRIGLRGYDVTSDQRPAANLVFLVDVSGSMDEQDKLPLVKSALTLLADRLTPRDRMSIVVYAGNAGIVLEPTADKAYVKAALDCLQAGGSTAGGEGIKLAYDTARANFLKGGINRIFIATDGDFNVGVTDNKALEEMVEHQRDDGITLTTLGFGTGNYNEALMERIADLGNGNYAYIDSAMEAQKVLDDELAATLVTIAKDVKMQVEFNPAEVKQYRLIGYENRALKEEDFDNDSVDAGDIGAGHQVTALYEIMPANAQGWLPDHRYQGNRPAAPSTTGDELCFVKLRYKLPDGGSSRLITQPVSASLMRSAVAPTGDMAFVTAVAAFGQKLRGDSYLGSYSFADAGALAGSPEGYWRQEFVKLARLASAQPPGTSAEE